MRRRFRQLAPDMVAVPAGVVLLGATASPQRTELPAFRISRGPVSCAEYLAFIVATDHPTPPYWGGDEPPAALLEHPVVDVTYSDARTYCRWLGTATDGEFWLPSETEWQHAAQGDDGRAYPWGDEWSPDSCNASASGAGGTAPIGSYPQDTSPYGCVDMAGNVEEWTGTRYAPADSAAPPDPNLVVVRGGSWRSDADAARCTSRLARDARQGDAARGFRVACAAE